MKQEETANLALTEGRHIDLPAPLKITTRCSVVIFSGAGRILLSADRVRLAVFPLFPDSTLN